MTEFASFYPSPRPVDETIELVGLAGKRVERVGSLSGGQRRRLDVGVGIVGDPELLFLDEPTTGFDPTARRDAWNMIEGLRALGTTIVLTTHYMDEAQHLADTVVILREGQIVAEGSPEKLGARGRESVIRFRMPDGIEPDDVAAAVGAAPSALRQRRDPSHREPAAGPVRAARVGPRARRRAPGPRGAQAEPGGRLPGDLTASRGRRLTTGMSDLTMVLKQTRYALISTSRNPRAVIFSSRLPGDPARDVQRDLQFKSGDTVKVSGETVAGSAYFTAGMIAYSMGLLCFSTSRWWR